MGHEKVRRNLKAQSMKPIFILCILKKYCELLIVFPQIVIHVKGHCFSLYFFLKKTFLSKSNVPRRHVLHLSLLLHHGFTYSRDPSLCPQGTATEGNDENRILRPSCQPRVFQKIVNNVLFLKHGSRLK